MDHLEQKILDAIEANREKIVAFARDLYTHAELGYKEFRTAEKFVEALKEAGIEDIREHLAITGVKGTLHGESDGPSVALVGELDALAIPNHKYAWEETGAAHCCGHHAQMAGIMGAAIALCDPEVLAALSGKVILYAVPSEECGEVEFKQGLMQEEKIRYLGGKSELIRIGEFDEVDISVVHHTQVSDVIQVGSGSGNGFTAKTISYQGLATHAAGSPHKGVNALNAATLGITAVQFQRETFRDKDTVRIHPIITKGGDLVNVIPDDVVVETLVRGKTMEAVMDADRKTNRAFLSGAMAIGAGCRIDTMPGYMPVIPFEKHEVVQHAAELSAGTAYSIKRVEATEHSTGSTDVGDLTHIMPVLTFGTGGASGGGHQVNYDITDEELAYIQTAKIFALTAYGLLKDGAKLAKEVQEGFAATLTKEAYLAYMESLLKTESVALDDPNVPVAEKAGR